MKYVRIPFNTHFLSSPGLDTRLLIEVLGYCPKDSKIIGFGQDQASLISYIFVSSDIFPDVTTNPPDCVAIFSCDTNGIVTCTGIDWPAHSSPAFAPATMPCTHVWVNYIGFTNSYNYCCQCGVKKP